MRKKLSLLFIIPLLIIPFKISAAGSTKQITLKQTTGIPINVRGINNSNVHHGSLYKIELDYQLALCLTANKPIVQGHEYVLVSKLNINESWKNLLLAKAYLYAVANKDDIVARAAAQIVAWKWKNWNNFNVNNTDAVMNSDLYGAFVQGLKNFKSNFKTRKLEGEDGEAFYRVKEMLNTPVPSNITISIWKDRDYNNHQEVLAYGVEDTPTPQTVETCKQVTVNNLSSCYGTYSTFGYAYQTTQGKCDLAYDLTKNNRYTIYGVMENANTGRYCRMYCNKFFYETFPGNIATAVNVGRYIVWPNNNVENNNYKIQSNLAEHPMALAIEKNCRISVDSHKLGLDYSQELANYNNYINANRDIYNTYVRDGRECTTYQNRFNEKNAVATSYCSRPEVVNEPLPATYKVSKTRTDCPGYNWKTHFCPEEVIINYSEDVEYQYHKDWRDRVDECNRLRGEANEALGILNTCNKIQNYVDAVAGVIKEFNTCVGYRASFNLGFSAPGATASFDDDEYGKTMNLKETKRADTCTGCNSGIGGISVTKYNVETNLIANGTLTNLVKAVNYREIIGTSIIYYDLADGYYNFVNKDNNKAVDSKNGLKNYSIIGFSNMPISYHANAKKNYNLRINVPMLTGDANVFSSIAARNNYVCHYKVTKTTSSKCVCPEGTKHAGESLECLSKDNDGTCLDNQTEYCDSDITIPHSCNPTSDGITCPNDPTMDITSCINAGKTYNWCVSNICYRYPDPDPGSPGNQRWVCPAGTNEGMDLSSCVIPMIVKGYSERDAYEYCRDVTCPYDGIKIIYRVIDLTNPFPSKDADRLVTQSNLRTGMFNDTLKGRYPGANWNSTKVVRDKILTNRNVDGDNVYNKKPLYEFTLNSALIKEIRNYNKRQRDSYADFNLNCLNDKTACVSSFVHSSLSGIVGGTCRNVTRNSFYTCNN